MSGIQAGVRLMMEQMLSTEASWWHSMMSSSWTCLNWARTDLWGIYLVIGVSTRQVRTSGDRDDPGGYRRLAVGGFGKQEGIHKKKQRRFISCT